MQALVRLRVNRLIRVEAAGMDKIVGRFVGTGGDTLFLAGEGRETRVPLGAIDSLWVRGSRSGRGAIYGALGLTSAFTVLCVTIDASPGHCEVGAIVWGGIGGAILGAGLGRLTKHWQLRYPT